MIRREDALAALQREHTHHRTWRSRSTIIFVPLCFLAGIYGMNIDNMPKLHSRCGYLALLGIMACIVTAQINYFRKKRWP